MILNIILLCACLITSGLFTYFRLVKTGFRSLFLKTLASTVLVISAVVLGFTHTSSLFSLFIIIGMLFGLLGDIFLDLKAVYPNDTKPYLYSGFICFEIGHLSYLGGIIYILRDSKDLWIYLLACIVAAVLLTFFIDYFCKKNKIDYHNCKVIVLIYTFILSYLLSISVCAFILNYHMWALMVGFVLFLASDSILSFMYFGDKKGDKIYCLVNHILYYLAQIFIVFSIIFIL